MLFLFLSRFQIYVISLAEPRLPLQLDDAVRPEVEGEEVKTLHTQTHFIIFVIEEKCESLAASIMQQICFLVMLSFHYYSVISFHCYVYFHYDSPDCISNFYRFDFCWTAVLGQNQRPFSLKYSRPL